MSLFLRYLWFRFAILAELLLKLINIAGSLGDNRWFQLWIWRRMKPRRMSDDVDGENSVMKTCCCCMDVRLGTIVLGFCHLVSNREIATLSFSVFSSDVCNESCKLMPAFQTLVLVASCDLFYSKFSFRTVSRRIR